MLVEFQAVLKTQMVKLLYIYSKLFKDIKEACIYVLFLN